MAYHVVGGQSLFIFEQAAPGSQYPSLVLIHGAGGTHLNWPPQIRRLKGVAVYAPDLPGHGRSGGVGRQTIAGYAGDIRDLLDTLSLERVVLGGHSMGGAIALQLALDAPERIIGLVLISTGARLRVSPVLLEGAQHNIEQVITFVTEYGYGAAVSERIKQMGVQSLREMVPTTLLGDYRACDSFSVRDRLGEITAPALVIGSLADRMVPEKLVRELADGLPDADLHWLRQGGHMLPVEQPEAVSELILRWLAQFHRGEVRG